MTRKVCTLLGALLRQPSRLLLAGVRVGAPVWTSLLPVALGAALFVSACTPESPPPPADVLTQKVMAPEKMPITVLVKYAFSINAFEEAVEKNFPQIDLVQVGNYTRDRGIVEYERRLEHDDLPDIVMTWPLHVGERFWEDRLIDLSTLPFTSRYNTSMLNNIARNGKLFYLPGPAQVRGIVYNKTLFAEKGWEVPTDFKGFVELCQKIEDSGMRSLQLGFGNSEVLDTAFVGFSYDSGFSTPADAQWLADYNKGKGSLARMRPALETFRAMMDAGVWKKSDISITYATREIMLFTRQCAMAEDSVLMARMGRSLTGTTDEFALMPFFTPGTAYDWVRLYMVCYIGLNKHLAEPQNKEKYELVLQLMNYISTVEGQAALAADTGAMYSSLKNVPAPDIPEIFHLREALRHNRYAVFPELQLSQDAFRTALKNMLAGRCTIDDVIHTVDQYNATPQSVSTEEIIAQATADFTLMETGNFLTDAMRTQSGAQIALFLDNGKDGRFNGKGISARLYQGAQTVDDVNRVLPDLKRSEKGVLQVVEMTGQDLTRTLEHSITTGNDRTGWFYYFSGLRMQYAPAAAPGSRIRSITTADGAPLVPDKLYTVAIMDETVPQDAIRTQRDTGLSILHVLTTAMRSQQTITPDKDGRFEVCQP